MEKAAAAMIKAVAVKMAETAEADVTGGTGGGSGRDDDGGIAASLLLRK
jgi:hypothetical protein